MELFIPQAWFLIQQMGKKIMQIYYLQLNYFVILDWFIGLIMELTQLKEHQWMVPLELFFIVQA